MTFPTAVISDIHGNLTALQVVMADIEQRGVGRVVCLGDVVGYGPDPVACLDLVREKCDFCLMGNHDFAVLFEPSSFNASAESSAFWTRRQFEKEPDPTMRRLRYEFLGGLPMRKIDEIGLWCHASPRKPVTEYIFPDDVVTAPNKMAQLFERVPSSDSGFARAFCGHTHVTGVFTDEPDFYPPADLGTAYSFDLEEKSIVNPGSVGQPRDRDPRASYAILHEDRVEFVRLEYDIDEVAGRIAQEPDLSNFLAERLYDGR